MNTLPLFTGYRRLRGCLLFLLTAALAAHAAPETVAEKSDSGFNLLPRSMSSNPAIDLTILTEMTEAGRKLPPPSPDRPTYYALQSAGYHAEGEPLGDRFQPAPEVLAAAFTRALATNGFLPTSNAHPPTLLIVYHWGAHANPDRGSSEIEGTGTADSGYRNFLSRAALVGGAKFAAELKVALEKQEIDNEINRTRAVGEQRLGLTPELGSFLTDFGPLRMFSERDPETRRLYLATLVDRYYVIASAYDYADAQRGRRTLLWRSKLTADAQGVALSDTVPGLILTGGKYFGVDMPKATTLTKRLKQESKVILGPLEVKDYYDKLPSQPAGAKP